MFHYLERPNSQRALYHRRLANTFESIANRAGREDKPWTDANVRMWQSFMVKHLAARSEVIRAYLDARRNR
jgi:hypothetical protein